MFEAASAVVGFLNSPLGLLLVSVALVPLGRRLFQEGSLYLARLYWAAPARQKELIDAVVATAVLAAEKLGSTQVVQDKKAYALAAVQRELAHYGVAVDVLDLSNRIEAACSSFFGNWPRSLPTATGPSVAPTQAPVTPSNWQVPDDLLKPLSL
jgi:hypothetical protein